jgi:hypothetical protein
MKYLGLFLIISFFAECTEKYVFSSSVFTEYFSHQNIPFQNQDPLKVNQQFIKKIREDQNPDDINRLFTGANLTSSYEQFLYQFTPRYQNGDFFQYLKDSLAALKADPHFKKSKTTFTNDSFSEGNLPFLQFTLPTGTKVLRMGLPIIEKSYLQSFFFSPALNPEFLVFVRSSQNHLYVNLMKREGLEGPSSKSLESQEKVEPALSVVTLDKNSDFYWQKGDYPDSIEDFKRAFYQQMTNPGGHYYWSINLKNLDLMQPMNAVHTQYFKNHQQLTVEERCDFIELTYLEILDQLVTLLNPHTMNITCKHAIDRGPSLTVLWQFKLGLATESQVTALLLAPPLLMHNRTSHESRLDRFTSAASFFYPKKNGHDRIK